MLRRRTTALFRSATLHFSTTITTTGKRFSKIPWKQRLKAIKELQKAITDYLPSTRSLPFPYAENIARNSPRSLSSIVSKSKIPYSASTIASFFQRFLRYHPINELDFFLESIRSKSGKACSVLPHNTIFLSDYKHYGAACALAGMGFPWGKLGLLCVDGFSVLESNPSYLESRVDAIKNIDGFNTVSVISICLAFPRVLYDNDKMDGLLSDLKVLFLDYDLLSCVEGGDIDAVVAVCEKINSFYDRGCEMGRMGDLMGRNKSVFIEHSRDVLINKIEYFRKLEVRIEQNAVFLLSRPEIFYFDLETGVVSISGFLKQLGLSDKELECHRQKYPHVFGRTRLANLPNAMRSMDLGKWFFQRMKYGNHSLLANCSTNCTEDVDRQYEEDIRKILAKKTHAYAIKKLEFLQGIGFGENRYTVKALVSLNGSGDQLLRRFYCLLNCGIEYSKLCTMMKLTPEILNQHENSLEKKIEYLCNDMGLSLESLHTFPAYLCYDLEGRITPRYKFHKWLKEQGLYQKEYSLSTFIASSEKTLITRLSSISLDVVRLWEEGRAGRAAG